MSTPIPTYNNSTPSSKHLEFCQKLNSKGVKDLNSSNTQQELNNAMTNVIKSASNDLSRPMTYAEMRERFG